MCHSHVSTFGGETLILNWERWTVCVCSVCMCQYKMKCNNNKEYTFTNSHLQRTLKGQIKNFILIFHLLVFFHSLFDRVLHGFHYFCLVFFNMDWLIVLMKVMLLSWWNQYCFFQFELRTIRMIITSLLLFFFGRLWHERREFS